jgi:hypothetical protein
VNTSDNYYPNVTTVRTGVPTMTTLGSYTVTYTVTDGAGNTTVVTRQVNVVDQIEPVIKLLGKNPVTHHRFTPYVDAGVKLTDNYYSDAQLRNELEMDDSKLNIDIPGLYFVKYSLTDPSGNQASSVQRLVEVVDFTGLNEATKAIGLEVFPNPSAGLITITTTSNMQHLKVVDIIGKVVLEPEVTGKTIQLNLSQLHKGIYFIQLETTDGKTGVQKIVLQ